MTKSPSGKRDNTEAYKSGRKIVKSNACFMFNSASGCNRSNGESCTKRGVVYKHYCNHVNGEGKICGAKDHGRDEHP